MRGPLAVRTVSGRRKKKARDRGYHVTTVVWDRTVACSGRKAAPAGTAPTGFGTGRGLHGRRHVIEETVAHTRGVTSRGATTTRNTSSRRRGTRGRATTHGLVLTVRGESSIDGIMRAGERKSTPKSHRYRQDIRRGMRNHRVQVRSTLGRSRVGREGKMAGILADMFAAGPESVPRASRDVPDLRTPARPRLQATVVPANPSRGLRTDRSRPDNNQTIGLERGTVVVVVWVITDVDRPRHLYAPPVPNRHRHSRRRRQRGPLRALAQPPAHTRRPLRLRAQKP